MENLNSLDLAKKCMLLFVSLFGEGQKVRFSVCFSFLLFFLMSTNIFNPLIYLFNTYILKKGDCSGWVTHLLEHHPILPKVVDLILGSCLCWR